MLDKKEYVKNVVEALNDLQASWGHLIGLLIEPSFMMDGFDVNEFLCTKRANKLLDESFAPYSLDELQISSWVEAIKNNIKKWLEDEKLEENDTWNKCLMFEEEENEE